MDLEELKGKLVEILHKNRPVPGFVKETKGKRLRILFPTGKEELINHQALIYTFENLKAPKSSSEAISLLREIQQKIETLKDSFDLREIWEVVEGEVEEISVQELAELYLGRRASDEECAALMVKVFEEKLFFKIGGLNSLLVLSKNEVEKILHQRQKEIEKLKLLSEGEAVLEALFQGKEAQIEEKKREYWLKLFKDYFLWEENSPSGKIAREVLSRKGFTDPAKLFELLVRCNVFAEDENIELLKLRFPREFSEKAKKEVEKILNLEEPLTERLDLTGLYTFTIDAEETQDFDDAISFVETEKGKEIYVHITDVASFIRPGMALWEEALERALTLYLPEETIPMLPFELSHGRFSLIKGALRPAVSFKISFDREGHLSNFEAMLSVIKIDERLTYDEVDEALREGNEFWKGLYNLLLSQKKLREEKGAFAIFLPEIQVKVDENGEIHLQRIELTPARELVAEAMILANTLSARLFHEKGIPGIYRTQPPPFEVIENPEDSLYLKILQLKYFAKSELSTSPAPHSGLGVDFYTTLTSPMRRFLDLFMQYQLISYLKGKEGISKEGITKILGELTENLQRALTIQNKRNKYFLLKYLQNYLKGEVLKGLVVEVFSKKAKVYLVDFNLTGELSYYTEGLRPGQEVKVKIEKINPRWEILRLKLIS
jgi:exoribonuclease-2